jgi:MFS transporter, DHA1 family, tetracycline resistance protein
VKEQTKEFWVILIIVFLGFLGTSMPYLIFPALFLNPAYSIFPASWSHSSHALFLGVTLAAYPLGQFIGSPILGAMSDDCGRKRILTISLLITAFFNLLTGLAIEWQHLSLLIFSRFAAGLMEGNVAIARAMAADLKTLAKHNTFGKINAASSIAYLVGPLVGGLMADQKLIKSFTTSTPFYAITILFIFLSALTVLILKNTPPPPQLQVRTFWQRINFIKRMSVLFTNRHLKFLMLISTLFTLAVDVFYEFGPIYLTVKWTLGPADLIIYNSLLCVGLAIGNGWLVTLCSLHLPHHKAILGGMGCFALFLLATTLTTSTFFMLSLFILLGLVIGVSVTLVTVKISDTAADTIQGEVLGVQLSLRVLGDVFICLFGGALLLLSSKLILILAAGLAVATLIYGLKLR